MSVPFPAILLVTLGIAGGYLYYREHDPAGSAAPSATPVPAAIPAATPTEKADVAALMPEARPPLGTAPLTSFDRMPDGSPIPELPPTTPKRIRVGVALFAYDGAQGVVKKSRTREEALVLAKNAIVKSAGDFGKLVRDADLGSNEDIGWVRRGILERRAEREIFLLEPGKTLSEPVDTPRGFWVVRRSE